MLGHKIPVYEPNKDSVMVMMERVTEAQRIAKLVRCFNSPVNSFLLKLSWQRKYKLTGVYYI